MCMYLATAHDRLGTEAHGHVMTRKGTPQKTSVFQAYLPKTITHFAITTPPI